MPEHVIVLSMTAVGLLLLKLQKRFRYEHYFYYGKLLDGFDTQISFFGIIFRTSIPLLCGLFSGLLTIFYRCPRSPEFYGAVTGLATAFLVVWPSIYNPEDSVSPAYYNRKKLLYVLRLMFVALFFSLGLLGGKLSVLTAQLASRAWGFEIASWIDAKGIATNLIASFLWLGIAAALGFGFKRVLRLFR
jgi:hypothetical protein